MKAVIEDNILKETNNLLAQSRELLKAGTWNLKNVDAKICRLARKDGLYASKSRKDGKWYFSDMNNWLHSPEGGLDDIGALEFLTESEVSE